MTTQAFKIVLSRSPTESELDALFEAGCDDGAFGTEGATTVVEFDREASRLGEAIVSAIQSLEAAGLGPVRIVDQDLLTLADIAERIGQSRESVRRYAAGTRGPGGFPPPVNPARDGTVFYRWSEVVPWFNREMGIEVSAEDPTLVAANLLLQARRLRSQVADMDALSTLMTK